MRGVASAAALALAAGGCGTETWFLFPFDASGPQADEVGSADASPDSPPLVGCTQESDCAALLEKHCDLSHQTCVFCTEDSQCQDQTGAPFCSFDHKCVACRTEPNTCGSDQVCQGTHCFYPCPDGGGCPASKPFCNTIQMRFVCVSCQNNCDCADAAVPSYCNTDVGECRVSDTPILCRPPTEEGGTLDSGDAAFDVELPDVVVDAGE